MQTKSISERLFDSESLAHSFLSAAEERELIEPAQGGDSRALDKIMRSFQRMVAKIAAGYYRSAVSGDIDKMDLIMWGNEGLLEAIKRFQPSKSVRLSTYATWWIRAKIRRNCLRNATAVTFSYGGSEKAFSIACKAGRFYQEEGRNPTSDEMEALANGDTFGVGAGRMLTLRDSVSIESMIYSSEEGAATLEETLPDTSSDTEGEALDNLEVAELLEAVSRLPEVTRRAVSMAFGLDGNGDRSVRAIGIAIGVPYDDARKLVSDGVKALKREIGGL